MHASFTVATSPLARRHLCPLLVPLHSGASILYRKDINSTATTDLCGQLEFLTSEDFCNVLYLSALLSLEYERVRDKTTHDVAKVGVDCCLDKTGEYGDRVKGAFCEVPDCQSLCWLPYMSSSRICSLGNPSESCLCLPCPARSKAG